MCVAMRVSLSSSPVDGYTHRLGREGLTCQSVGIAFAETAGAW